MAYHKREIQKGEVGCVSKIREELDELEEVAERGQRILCLWELADIYLAMEMFIERNYGHMLSMSDVEQLAHETRLAFRDGTRNTNIR